MSWQLPLLYMEFLRFYEVEIMKESTATALNVNIIKSHNSWFETKVTHIVSWPLFLSLLCTTQQTSVLKLHRCVSILQFVPASYYSKCSWQHSSDTTTVKRKIKAVARDVQRCAAQDSRGWCKLFFLAWKVSCWLLSREGHQIKLTTV